MKKICHASLLMLCISLNAAAQSVEQMTYSAYLNASLSLWEKAVGISQEVYHKQKDETSLRAHVLAMYGLLNATMKDKNEKMFEKYAGTYEDRLDDLEKFRERKGEAYALRSALYGFRIAYSPWTGMYYGPKSSSAIDKALRLDPDSPLVQRLVGTNLLFTPEVWGGDRVKALEAFEKSNNTLSKNPEQNWMLLDNLAWIGIIHRKENAPDKARHTWEQALTYEPNFVWVKNTLMPSLK